MKQLSKPHTLTALEALSHRTTLTASTKAIFGTIRNRYELECQFEHFLKITGNDQFECIWQYYTHHNIYINLILITDNAVHLFKFNNYHGLHYIDGDGMLVNSISLEAHADLSELYCMKYSVINVMPETSTHLPVYTKCVMMNESFELDVHSYNGDILTKQQIIPYLERLSRSSKKKKTAPLVLSY
ncbi:hypothetical protein [Macrococcus armenti]|uniref:hypothetical protein n=1 Tax=Macrococcus armenti TaxID=2875764 RepID=UPI001CCB65DF|nr:hypothetical protein [Macrococcus armenti]UBH13923.1 hypothetical protein LAU43_04300 [Macrococcus armenti]